MRSQSYNRFGIGYQQTRRADPRIAAQLWTAIGVGNSVLNVGAGTGSYEPATTLLAVEPSREMISQRPSSAAPVVLARAEQLPVASNVVDVALAVLTVHHWSDVAAGLREMARVARTRVVILTWDVAVFSRFWLLAEYLPAAALTDAKLAITRAELVRGLAPSRFDIEPLEVPFDCTDGFGAAYWRRPEAYFDPAVQASMSMLARTPTQLLGPGLEQLRRDIDSGLWHHKHANLLQRRSFDAGYYIFTAHLNK
ncbi:MAG: class I SAM-dependent methyltransferase [Antricoccus sp.]